MWDVVKHLTDCSFVMKIFSRRSPFESFIIFHDEININWCWVL